MPQVPVPMAIPHGYDSSWGNDYLGQSLQRACHIEPVIKRYGIDELTAWVDMPLPETVECIDMDDRRVIADETVREMLLRKCGARTIPEFQLHSKGLIAHEKTEVALTPNSLPLSK